VSTEGYGVEPTEVAAVWEALVGDREPGEDDMARWVHLSSRAALVTELGKRIAAERAQITGGWAAEGDSYSTIAARIGLSRARAQQFVEQSRKSRRTATTTED
jgi:hypothetical protein